MNPYYLHVNSNSPRHIRSLTMRDATTISVNNDDNFLKRFKRKTFEKVDGAIQKTYPLATLTDEVITKIENEASKNAVAGLFIHNQGGKSVDKNGNIVANNERVVYTQMQQDHSPFEGETKNKLLDQFELAFQFYLENILKKSNPLGFKENDVIEGLAKFKKVLLDEKARKDFNEKFSKSIHAKRLLTGTSFDAKYVRFIDKLDEEVKQKGYEISKVFAKEFKQRGLYRGHIETGVGFVAVPMLEGFLFNQGVKELQQDNLSGFKKYSVVSNLLGAITSFLIANGASNGVRPLIMEGRKEFIFLDLAIKLSHWVRPFVEALYSYVDPLAKYTGSPNINNLSKSLSWTEFLLSSINGSSLIGFGVHFAHAYKSLETAFKVGQKLSRLENFQRIVGYKLFGWGQIIAGILTCFTPLLSKIATAVKNKNTEKFIKENHLEEQKEVLLKEREELTDNLHKRFEEIFIIMKKNNEKVSNPKLKLTNEEIETRAKEQVIKEFAPKIEEHENKIKTFMELNDKAGETINKTSDKILWFAKMFGNFANILINLNMFTHIILAPHDKSLIGNTLNKIETENLKFGQAFVQSWRQFNGWQKASTIGLSAAVPIMGLEFVRDLGGAGSPFGHKLDIPIIQSFLDSKAIKWFMQYGWFVGGLGG